MSGFDAFIGDTPGAVELKRLVEKAQRAFAWRGEVDELSARVSHQGVTVTVNGSGALTGLRLDRAACDDGGQELAGRILTAVARAQSEVSEAVLTSARRTFGDDSPEVGTIEASLASRRSPAPRAEDDPA